MKYIFILAFSLMVMLFYSCEDVIELDLNTTEPRVIIEADLDGSTGTLVVKCSRTVDFYSESAFNPISDAVISLEGAKSGAITINEAEPGIYRLTDYNVIPGNAYRIKITVDDIDYEAEAVAPDPAEIEDLIVMPFDIQGPPPEVNFYTIATGWFDIPGNSSFYCLRLILDEDLRGDRTFVSDKDQDGELLFVTSFTSDLAPGDTVKVELSSINEAVYDYFLQVEDMSSNGFSAAAPYNPKGNFSNEAMGYFGVCYTNKKEAVAQ